MKLNKDIELIEFTPIKSDNVTNTSNASNSLTSTMATNGTAHSAGFTNAAGTFSNASLQANQAQHQANQSYSGALQGYSGSNTSGQLGYATTTANYYWPNYYQGHLYQYPYSGIQYHFFYPQYKAEPMYELQTKKVENGFIVLKNGKEYVFSNTKSLAKFIAASYTPKKEAKK